MLDYFHSTIIYCKMAKGTQTGWSKHQQYVQHCTGLKSRQSPCPEQLTILIVQGRRNAQKSKEEMSRSFTTVTHYPNFSENVADFTPFTLRLKNKIPCALSISL